MGLRQALIATALAVTAGAAAACGAEEGGRIEVGIAALKFSPDSVKARVGDTVVWENRDLVPHTVSGPFESGAIGVGGDFEVVLTEPGRISYSCAYHPGMRGTLTVADAPRE